MVWFSIMSRTCLAYNCMPWNRLQRQGIQYQYAGIDIVSTSFNIYISMICHSVSPIHWCIFGTELHNFSLFFFFFGLILFFRNFMKGIFIFISSDLMFYFFFVPIFCSFILRTILLMVLTECFSSTEELFLLYPDGPLSRLMFLPSPFHNFFLS